MKTLTPRYGDRGGGPATPWGVQRRYAGLAARGRHEARAEGGGLRGIGPRRRGSARATGTYNCFR